jgi:small subunit ribosomal protein S9
MEVLNTSGRRKTAIARIYLTEGKGEITVNKKNYKEHFTTAPLQYIVTQPFEICDLKGKYDVKANLSGGGIKGQAEALRDPREVERKKPGQPKARKRFQFSKR